MSLKVGNRVTVNVPEGHPLRRWSGKVGEIVQIGDGPHHEPTGTGEKSAPTVIFTKGHSATCPDPTKPYLVDSQYIQGNLGGPGGMREWYSEDELELG